MKIRELMTVCDLSWDKLYEEARMAALMAHQYQPYDIFPYEKHLIDVVNIIKSYNLAGIYIIAAWLHDSIEDGNLTYNKIKRAFGEEVADIVLAVTDPIDMKNRKEKKAAVYKKINANTNALIIKLADRMANIKNSVRFQNTSKYKMYLDEKDSFRRELYFDSDDAILNKMWED
jgi:(p)ppGpp synthase/HD superfamily hydrolase